MKRNAVAIVILAVIFGLLFPVEATAEFTTLPEDFADQLVVSAANLRLDDNDVPRPTAIAWLPGADLLVITQQGGVFRADEGGGAVALLDLRPEGVCSMSVNNEMGLLGVAIDPDFGANSHVFLYYTDRKGNDRCANRVSRFTLESGNALVDEDVLIDNIAAPNGNHNGGDLQFGNDDLLYISVGDGGQDLRNGATQDGNRNARRLDLLNGKILRITSDGAIPEDNPFRGPGTARCSATGSLERQGQRVEAEKKTKKQKRKARKRKRKNRRDREPATVCREIFSTGLRNPYRIAFDPNDSERFYINDVGGSGFEEVNEGAAGADYGWNLREGLCRINDFGNCSPTRGFTDPVFAYRRDGAPPFDGCRSITGGAFVPNDTSWPGLGDTYLFADLFCNRIFALAGEGAGSTVDVFAAGGGASHLAFGPDGSLYYTAIFSGEIRRIAYGPA